MLYWEEERAKTGVAGGQDHGAGTVLRARFPGCCWETVFPGGGALQVFD